jgi:hypothetical protein
MVAEQKAHRYASASIIRNYVKPMILRRKTGNSGNARKALVGFKERLS